MKNILILLSFLITGVVNSQDIINNVLHNKTKTKSEILAITDGVAGDTYIPNNATTEVYTIIHDGTAQLKANGDFPTAIITSITPNRFNHNSTEDVNINGSYFTVENGNITLPNYTINSFNIVSANLIEANITSNSTDGFFDLTVFNISGNSTLTNAVETKLSTWVDLRLGGDTFTHGNSAGNDIRYRSGMLLVRDSNGISFTGANPWQSWVKLEYLKWTRGQNKTLQWIFSKPTSNMMIGIGSDATNENDNAQYQQAEIEAYFNNTDSFWGVYGNSGTVGLAGNQNNSASIATGNTFKIKITNDGGVGGTFTLYRVQSPNPSDWDDETDIITSFTTCDCSRKNKI